MHTHQHTNKHKHTQSILYTQSEVLVWFALSSFIFLLFFRLCQNVYLVSYVIYFMAPFAILYSGTCLLLLLDCLIDITISF